MERRDVQGVRQGEDVSGPGGEGWGGVQGGEPHAPSVEGDEAEVGCEGCGVPFEAFEAGGGRPVEEEGWGAGGGPVLGVA